MDTSPTDTRQSIQHNNSFPRSLWRRLARQYRERCNFRRSIRANSDVHEPFKLNQLDAKNKLDKFKLLTKTNFSAINSTEPHRVSCFTLFKDNLLDPVLHRSITIVFLICQTLLKDSTWLSFIVLFTCLYWLVNNHIESYRSFKKVRKYVDKLDCDETLRKTFISTHLGYNPKQRLLITNNPLDDFVDDKPVLDDEDATTDGIRDDKPKNTFRWLNKIIAFFWPYLSHVIHYELDQFFLDQIESGSMARSEKGMKRFFYAIIRQLDTNILFIEKCQLGTHAPFINDIEVFNSRTIHTPNKENKNRRLSSSMDNLISYNVELAYKGDMNIAFVYKYFCCCSSRIGLKDVFLYSRARITLGPIENDLPIVDKISFTLLELPIYGYKGIALVELAELKVARNAINKLIKANVLYPRIVTVNIKDLFDRITKGPVDKTQSVNTIGSNEVSLWTRLMAQFVLCGCMCSNICLRCCQKDDSETLSESERTITSLRGQLSFNGSRN